MFIVSHKRKSNMGAHSFSIISNSANCFTAKLPSPYPPARFSPWKCMIRNANVRQIKNTLSGSSRLQLELDRGLYQDSKAASILSLEDSSKIFQLKEYQNASVSSHVDEDIVKVRRLFSENESRQTSVSAYDTAWVAMVPSLENSKLPQFPQCLSMVMDNQLGDGSWGLSDLPYIKDRLSHTLACIIVLRTWNVGNKNVEMGLRFIRENIGKIAREDQYNPIGFDIIFSAMLEDARSLCLELSYDSPPIKLILTRRKEILNSIAIDDMNEYDSPLIYSIEGIRRIVDWNKVLTHQNKDGSLFHSPSATACALMHTGKPSFLKYLSSMLQNLGNGVPSVYPINIFASLSMVDRLERLGIARHFKSEIKQTLDDVYRWWTQNEIIEGRSSPSDIVNSSMSFKILRCNGYDVSPDDFLGCLKDGDFLPSVEKSGQAVTAMLNLYRASQVMFPEERILGEVKSFSRNSLSKRQANGTMHDQNMVMKDLAGEVEYALSIPWLASLERIEHRSYIEQYGVDDIWVGKTSYRIPCISNELFLTLAKKDYNMCQEIQQKELQELEKWYEDGKFGDLNFARQKLLYSYFSIASTLFSPEMSAVRMVWTKNAALITLIDDFYDVEGSIEELQVFVEAVKRWDPTVLHGSSDSMQILFSGLYSTVNDIAQNACAFQGRDVSTHFKEIWYRVVSSMMEEAEWAKTGYVPSMQEYIENGIVSMALEPNVVLPIYFVGPKLSEQIMQLPEHSNLLQLLSTFGRLLNDTRTYPKEAKEGKHNSVTLYMKNNPLTSAEDAIAEIRKTIDESAHKLLKIVVQPSGVPRECKELYWYMLRALQLFYLNIDGVTSPTEILQYVNSVIFYPVL